MPAWDAGDHASIRTTLATSVQRLAHAGSDFFVCPDNTAHMALEDPGPALPIPGLHIAETVADHVARDRRTRIGLLGTIYTMESSLYPRALAARGIAAEVPDRDDRRAVNEIIFEELVNGVVTTAARYEYLKVIDRLAGRGCDAVALVCTEIPLLIAPEVSPLPTSDSTRLIARAAYDVAVGNRSMLTWRGRPTHSSKHGTEGLSRGAADFGDGRRDLLPG